ncbi:hypothetical protein KSS87_020668 [Heliosperma pusillum]|nr:hypothetical protein KSS87_020668 [Heliosperma pusillum]KAH9627019.1 hypothetical protein KSS87_020668 [Heliosperma pusillum]
MGKKCRKDDSVSYGDQISQNLASSVIDSKTSKQNSRDGDASTLSSERVPFTNHTFIRSDVSSEIGQQTSNEKRKYLLEVQGEDSTTMISYPCKQRKADSSSSKNSSAVVQLSSVDSVDPKPAHSLTNHGSSHPTQSVESKTAFQEPEHYMTNASMKNSHLEFNLNEGIEENEADWHPKSIHESSYCRSGVLSEPIPVVAKVGIPMGLPKKPLQFGGELGWKRSGITSAFRSTPLSDPDIKKAPVSERFEFDLNIAATMEPECPVDEASLYVSPNVSERFHLNGHRPGSLGIDLNHDQMVEEPCKNSFYTQSDTQQLLQNFDRFSSTVTCSGASHSSNVSNYTRRPYWVDLSPVRGYGHIQGPPFLMGAPNAEQLQMVVPIQLPYTPPGLYFGNLNNITPTFYPHSGLPPQYPGNFRLLENSQGLNPHAFPNMRQITLPNGNIGLMENGSRACNSTIPPRNNIFEGRMNPVEQVVGPSSSVRRGELGLMPGTPSRLI